MSCAPYSFKGGQGPVHGGCEAIESLQLLQQHNRGRRHVQAVLLSDLVNVVLLRNPLQDVTSRVVDELVAADTATGVAWRSQNIISMQSMPNRLPKTCIFITCLGLKFNELRPHVASRLGVVADLGVWIETEHLGRVGQRQRVDVFCSNVKDKTD